MDKKTKIALKRGRKDPVFFAESLLKNADNEPLRLDPWQKAYLRDNATFRALRWGRRTGKSTVIAVESIHECIYKKDRNIIIISADSNKVDDIARELNGLIHRSPSVSSSVGVDNRHSKEFHNRSRIKILTGGSKSGSAGTSAVGGSATSLYLDEIQDIDEENVKIILPTVVGQLSPPRMTIAGTPRTRGDYSDSLFMDNFRIIIEGRRMKETNPDGAYSYHFCKTCDVDEDGNITNIRNPRITHESLRLLQRSMKIFFNREFALEFIDSVTAVYPEELRNSCGILSKPSQFMSNDLAICGLDYGKQKNNSVLCIATFNQLQNRWEAGYFKTWELGTQYKQIAHYVNTILPIKFKNIRFMLFDQTGVGNAACENLELSVKPRKQGILFSQPSKVTLAENCVEYLEKQRLVYYKHPTLDNEMKAYSRDLSSNDKIIYVKGESDDFVDALNLCALAIHMYEQNTSKYGPKLKMADINSYNQVLTSLGMRSMDRKEKVLHTSPLINNHTDNLRNARLYR